jgi:phosphoketolase
VNKPVRSPLTPAPLSPDLLEKMDAYWRAANYLTVGQIYLQDNPLLETPLTIGHIRLRPCRGFCSTRRGCGDFGARLVAEAARASTAGDVETLGAAHHAIRELP